MESKASDRAKGYCCHVDEKQWRELVKAADRSGLKVSAACRCCTIFSPHHAMISDKGELIVQPELGKKISYPEFLSRLKGTYLDKDAIMEEAKRRYPKGTVVRCIVAGHGVSKGEFYWCSSGRSNLVMDGSSVLVYHGESSKWAEVITEAPKTEAGPMTREQILEEAKRRYLPGARVRCFGPGAVKSDVAVIAADASNLKFSSDVAYIDTGTNKPNVLVYHGGCGGGPDYPKWAEIVTDQDLKVGDEVVFRVNGKDVGYKVTPNHLRVHGCGRNREVFNRLGLSKEGKMALAVSAYGYPISVEHGGYDWPECKAGDMAALTRLVNLLHLMCREHDAKKLVPTSVEVDCETCEGSGTVMVGKLYPSGHTEVNEECPDCRGEGVISTTPASAETTPTHKGSETHQHGSGNDEKKNDLSAVSRKLKEYPLTPEEAFIDPPVRMQVSDGSWADKEIEKCAAGSVPSAFWVEDIDNHIDMIKEAVRHEKTFIQAATEYQHAHDHFAMSLNEKIASLRDHGKVIDPLFIEPPIVIRK